MKSAKVLVAVSLMAQVSSADTSPRLATPPDYRSAIASAPVSEVSDSRTWISNCVRLWANFASEREALFAQFESKSNSEFSVVLEVGNSSFPKHEFVFVADNFLRTSLGRKDGALADAEVASLRSLIFDHIDDIRGSAVHSGLDANCYFLTMHLGKKRSQVVVYGSNDTSVAGKVVKEILSLGLGKAGL